MLKDHVCAGRIPETGQWHGLYYQNCPTPSGCGRPILRCSTKQGYDTYRQAVDAITTALGGKDHLRKLGIDFVDDKEEKKGEVV